MITGKIDHLHSKYHWVLPLCLLLTVALSPVTPVQGNGLDDLANRPASAIPVPPLPNQRTNPTDSENASPSRSPLPGDLDFEDNTSGTLSAADSRNPAVETIQAVVVRSWGGCGGSLPWKSLNANWSSYGLTPIEIDYSNPDLCYEPITYAALAASGADVVIISDPAGGRQQYSDLEISALSDYAREGHNVIGTFLVFQWGEVDNRGLAPLFGLSSTIDYTSVVVVPTYDVIEATSPLFANMASPYVSSGYAQSQVPLDDATWDDNDLNGARFVAKTADSQAAITVYDGPEYHGIHITNMPEYGAGTEDERFLYNAITFSVTRLYLPLAPHNE